MTSASSPSVCVCVCVCVCWEGESLRLLISPDEACVERRWCFCCVIKVRVQGGTEGSSGEGCRRSLRKVVEAHGHADVAGEADVDAEVDESLSPRAWRDERNMV